MTKLASLSYSPPVLGNTLHEESAAKLKQKWAEGDEKKLEEACAEFESLFINMVMKQMRKTVVKSGLMDGGKGEEIFTEMMDVEISKEMSLRQGLGLREALIEQLTGKRVNVLPSSSAVHEYDKNHAENEDEQPLELPLSGSISSPYGWRKDPFTGKQDFHHGIDIARPHGSDIVAAAEGKVVFSGWKEGYGRIVEIEHQNGMSTRYAHNSRNLVKKGERVVKHQSVALVGNSGRSTGAHLHYEVRKNGEVVNPAQLTRMTKGGWYAKKF